jgi:hypothetical protein
MMCRRVVGVILIGPPSALFAGKSLRDETAGIAGTDLFDGQAPAAPETTC